MMSKKQNLKFLVLPCEVAFPPEGASWKQEGEVARATSPSAIPLEGAFWNQEGACFGSRE
jgi:hypothetical protein